LLAKVIKTVNISFTTKWPVSSSYRWFFIGYWIKRPGFLSGLLFVVTDYTGFLLILPAEKGVAKESQKNINQVSVILGHLWQKNTLRCGGEYQKNLS